MVMQYMYGNYIYIVMWVQEGRDWHFGQTLDFFCWLTKFKLKYTIQNLFQVKVVLFLWPKQDAKNNK